MQAMGEIDTNPIASVQSALSLFGEKRGHRKRNESISSDDKEKEKEKVHESMLKGLAIFKIQLEAKDLVYNQTIHKLDQSEKTAEELSSLLKKSELEKHLHISKCTEAHRRIEELQSQLTEMADELSKSAMDRDELSNALIELEIELAVNREANVETMREMEMMKTKSHRELEIFLELKEAYMKLNSNAEKAKNEKCNLLSEKEAELELAMKAASEMEEELKKAKCELEILPELERQLANKDSLYSEMQTKAEVEIAMLNSQLHKGRSRIAAAEAAEERAKIEKAELFLAVQQLALEIEEVKKDDQIQEQENKKPLMVEESIGEEMMKELEMARTKIWELRTLAEQAGTRAEEAEKAKAEMEALITKRREKRERRMAALTALKEETFSSSSINNQTDQPLGKLLNLKLNS